MNIFVGNLLFEATERDVKKVFEGFGTVSSVVIVMDKKGINSRGFGFVEMPNDQEAQDAIAALDGKELMGRSLDVSPSRPRTERERKRGRYKTGRRTRSYMRRIGAMSQKESKPVWKARPKSRPGA